MTSTPSPDLDAVSRLIRDVANLVIDPRFRKLAADDVSEKAPGEVVTVVDQEAEALLTDGLADITPGVRIIGEEAASADTALLDLLVGGEGQVWLVDALDGTPGFVAGSPDHAVMLALVADGLTVAGLIYQPQHDRLYVAERGSGAFLDGARLTRPVTEQRPLSELRGGVMRRFLDEKTRASISANEHRFGDLTPGTTCAGVEYPSIASGERDFLLFWRTLPWDHAAGTLLVTESGGVARRLDGSDYTPTRSANGLLVSSDASCTERVTAGLGLASTATSAGP